jgi:hypothetical protein
MNLLLPQTRAGVVLDARTVDIHGDRYVDLRLSLDGAEPGATPTVGRVSASECPADLAPGTRVSVRFVMGVMTKVERGGDT